MAQLKLEFTKEAAKDFKRLPKDKRTKAASAVSKLKAYPLSGKKLEGKLTQLRVIRVWPYRIVYHFDTKSKTLTIESIEHRQGVYK